MTVKAKIAAILESAGYIDGHMSGPELAWVNMIDVPTEQRRKGEATRIYQEWEASLPKTVRLVRLYLAGDGTGAAAYFWDKMGFSYTYDGDDMNMDETSYMWKGVNGYPTPPTINVDDRVED